MYLDIFQRAFYFHNKYEIILSLLQNSRWNLFLFKTNSIEKFKISGTLLQHILLKQTLSVIIKLFKAYVSSVLWWDSKKEILFPYWGTSFKLQYQSSKKMSKSHHGTTSRVQDLKYSRFRLLLEKFLHHFKLTCNDFVWKKTDYLYSLLTSMIFFYLNIILCDQILFFA